jgi:hypothetical protein
MSSGAKIAIGIVLGLVLLVGGTVGYIMSAKFTGERYEQSVLAQDESMQNTWGQMEQLLKMQGFTVKNYGETFIKSLKANAERYANDKNAMMKWLQEARSQMSEKAHTKLMETMEKVYAKKEARQLSKISVVQEYRTWRSATLKGTIGVALFNFPSEKVKKIEDRIISTKQTKQTWETGEEEVKDPFAS